MAEGGEVRNHEAEIEAVARALNEDVPPWTFRQAAEGKPHAEEELARVAIAALDAVRSPQGEDHEPKAYDCGIHAGQWKGDAVPRCAICASQGEEHEPCATCAPMQCDCDDGPVQGGTTERLRSSPEREPTRLGTVCEQCERRTMEPVYTEDGDVFCGRCAVQLAPFPERDTEKLVEALKQIADCTLIVSEGGERWIDTEMPMRMAREALAEFSDASKEER
jgi:hypothetical protein